MPPNTGLGSPYARIFQCNACGSSSAAINRCPVRTDLCRGSRVKERGTFSLGIDQRDAAAFGQTTGHQPSGSGNQDEVLRPIQPTDKAETTDRRACRSARSQEWITAGIASTTKRDGPPQASGSTLSMVLKRTISGLMSARSLRCRRHADGCLSYGARFAPYGRLRQIRVEAQGKQQAFDHQMDHYTVQIDWVAGYS
jgi:hypothetical protein